MSNHIAHTATALQVAKQKTWLRIENIVPTHAIVGVGVLAKGHRLYEAAKSTKQEGVENISIEPILSDIAKLVKHTDRLKRGYLLVRDRLVLLVTLLLFLEL